jgi:hypothetical protein
LPDQTGTLLTGSGALNINASAPTSSLTLDASGNLGVGTTSPAVRFHVSGSSTYVAGVEGSSTFALMGFKASGTTGTLADANVAIGATGDALYMRAGGSERARITSGGDFLVGTTNASGSAGVGSKVISTAAGFIFAQVTAETTNGAATAYNYYSTGAGAFRFYVGAGGTVFATSTSISAISDRTLKENIHDLETGLTEVMALKPRRFDWKNGDAQNVAGFVAQEVEEVLPELVTDYVYSKDEDGNDTIKKSLKMGDILPTLVKAIQELKADLDATKAELAALKGQQ